MTFISDKKAQLAGFLSPSLLLARRKLNSRPVHASELAEDRMNVTYRDMQDRLQIPIRETTDDQIEGDKAREYGLFMARQDRWGELADKIQQHDQARDATPAGVSLAELMAFGARSDVVRAAEHSLLHGKPAQDSDFFSGIEALETVLFERPDNYPIALIVAHMHIDIGWAWRGARSTDSVQEINREAFEAHFVRAADILADFDPHEMHSPALSAARCALLPGKPDPSAHLIREFESLIELDPNNPRHMRALGNYLLPRWYGTHQALDLEARRTAARTLDVWGAGAYTWVWFDALLVDPEGYETLEVDYFLDGVKDILERRPNQHVANLLAAHLFQSWQITRQRYHETGCRPDLPPALRRGFEDVVHNHLRELHPLIWGHAEIGFENTARIISTERLANKGQETALNAVAMPFLKNLQAGETIQFGPDGINQNPR